MTTTTAERVPAPFARHLIGTEPETLAVLAARALNAKINGTGSDFDQAQVALTRGFIRAGISPNMMALLVKCDVLAFDAPLDALRGGGNV